jgi:hypothetical protein
MEPSQKKRINLYIDQNLLDFGKRYSQVLEQSLSSLVEGYLRREEEKTRAFSAEQYLEYEFEQDKEWYFLSGKFAEDDANYIEEYLKDKEEVEYCRNNPDSIRAKMRIQLLKEQTERDKLISEQEALESKKREVERESFIKRWNATFK